MPILRGCCCLDLKTGSKLIGIITLILEIVGFLSMALSLIVFWLMEDIVRQALEQIRNNAAAAESKNTNEFHDRNLRNGIVDYDFNQEDVNNQEVERILNFFIQNLYIVKAILLVIMAFQLLDIIGSSCLIHGIRRNRRGYLIPFIVLHFIYIVVELGFVVLIITVYAYIGMLHAFFVGIIIADLVWLAIHTYLNLVVVSEHQALGLILMHSNDEMCLK